jgi:hypothetical protein
LTGTGFMLANRVRITADYGPEFAVRQWPNLWSLSSGQPAIGEMPSRCHP